MSFQYTPEMDARLKQLVSVDALPTSKVAQILTREFSVQITRNSVIGRYNRMKRRDKTLKTFDPNDKRPKAQPVVRKRKPRTIKASVERAKLAAANVVLKIGGERGVPISEVTGCRFAVSEHEVLPDQHRFCNGHTVPGSSYCPAHYSIVYRVPQKPEVKAA